MDGEGCIGIYKDNTTYKLVMVVTSTSIGWLRELQIKWNGTGHIYVTPAVGNHRAKGTWTMYGTYAQKVIAEIIPYLGIKYAQAELALQFQFPERIKSPETGRFVRASAEDRVQQSELAVAIKQLKTAAAAL